jgi:hypothetical protein
MGDPGQQENSDREEEKKIERVRELVTPSFDPVEHAGQKTSSYLEFRHVSTKYYLSGKLSRTKRPGKVK